MHIHTNLKRHEFGAALGNSGAPIAFEKITEHGSRKRARAFKFALTGSGGRNNTGLYGAGDYDGATWDEWGAFLGALFELDPTATVVGSYADAADFHRATGSRFKGRTLMLPDSNVRTVHLPADTHPRHSWKRDDLRGPARCTFKAGCSAVRP